MSLDSLDTPLRLTWDLCEQGRPGLHDAELLRVAERLVDAGLFYLLLDGQPLLHPQIEPLLQGLGDAGCRISLVLGRDPREERRLALLPEGVDLLVDAAPWLDAGEDLRPLAEFLARLVQPGRRPSLLWVPRHGQLGRLPALFALCRELSLPRFKLPNYKIGVNSGRVETAEILQQPDLEELAQILRLQPADYGDTALEVHDLFLWELLFPGGGGERSEYGGCQAGNSLGHIAANGDLWPCSSWPVVLGSLLREEVHHLWASAQRHAVRAAVDVEPADCRGCADLAICFGGCRGLALTLGNDGMRRDLLCAGPRKGKSD